MLAIKNRQRKLFTRQ